MTGSAKLLAGTAALIALGAVTIFAPRASAQGQSASSGVFTQDQANAGHSAYALSCAGCHRADLGGNGIMTSFGGKSTKDLYNFIASSMPGGAPGSLSEDQYTNITAYLLRANGAKPGTASFSKNTDVKVSTIANGKVVDDAIKPAP